MTSPGSGSGAAGTVNVQGNSTASGMPSPRRRGSSGAGADEMAKPTRMDHELGVRLAGMPFAEAFDGGAVIHRVSEPSVRQLVEMRHNDGQARGLYRLLTMPVRAAAKRATWMPADPKAGGSGDGTAEAEFAEALFNTPATSGGMMTPIHQVIGQMLLSVFDGFAPFELVYHQPKNGPLQGKYALRKIAYRPSETVSFVVTDHGEFNGLKQRTYSPNGKFIDERIERDNSLYVSMNEEENPFYGVSYFNAAFYHYDKKVKLYYLAHLAAQHRAVGSRLGKYPQTASSTEIAQFRKALADFGLAQSVTVPDKGWSVEDLGKSLTDFPYMDFINHHNSQSSKSVLSAFFDDAQGGQKSLVDFSNPGDSMYTMLIDVIINELEQIFNNLVARFIDWNFGTRAYPRIKFGTFSDDQKRAIKETFDKLAASGVNANVTRPFLFELEKTMAEEMGLDIDYKEMGEALEKQTKLSLLHFTEEAATPPNMRPFQPVGAQPPDQQQGVPPMQQWLPGPGGEMGTISGGQGGTPPGGGGPPLPGGPTDAPEPPPSRDSGASAPDDAPNARRRRRVPALPSQLKASAGYDPDVEADAEAIAAVLARMREREQVVNT